MQKSDLEPPKNVPNGDNEETCGSIGQKTDIDTKLSTEEHLKTIPNSGVFPEGYVFYNAYIHYNGYFYYQGAYDYNGYVGYFQEQYVVNSEKQLATTQDVLLYQGILF